MCCGCDLQDHLDISRDYNYTGVHVPMSRLGETLPAPTCQDEDNDVTTSTCCLSSRHHLQPERLQVSCLTDSYQRTNIIHIFHQ